MQSLHNIEKSAFHKGQYVGYASGLVFRIWRQDKWWVAVSGKHRLSAPTLGLLSVCLENVIPC
jgi:hypothetical protein